jgi:hypothetical protein
MASSVSNLNVASNPIMHASPAAGVSDLWSGASADGQTIAPDDTTMNFEVLANAQIEPDVDGDGFGDETQDACPKDASKQAPCPVIDKTAPVVSDASFSNTAFFVDKAGQAARTSRSAPKGTVLRFKLSEPAAVTVTIERAAKGRKVKGKCAKATHRNRKRKRCALYKQSGSFKLAGQAGPNEKTFSGKVGGKSLRRGSYRATLVATDTAGNKSKAAELRFSIVRR